MGGNGKLPDTRGEQDYKIKQEATRQKTLKKTNLTCQPGSQSGLVCTLNARRKSYAISGISKLRELKKFQISPICIERIICGMQCKVLYIKLLARH